MSSLRRKDSIRLKLKLVIDFAQNNFRGILWIQ